MVSEVHCHYVPWAAGALDIIQTTWLILSISTLGHSFRSRWLRWENMLEEWQSQQNSINQALMVEWWEIFEKNKKTSSETTQPESGATVHLSAWQWPKICTERQRWSSLGSHWLSLSFSAKFQTKTTSVERHGCWSTDTSWNCNRRGLYKELNLNSKSLLKNVKVGQWAKVATIYLSIYN